MEKFPVKHPKAQKSSRQMPPFGRIYRPKKEKFYGDHNSEAELKNRSSITVASLSFWKLAIVAWSGTVLSSESTYTGCLLYKADLSHGGHTPDSYIQIPAAWTSFSDLFFSISEGMFVQAPYNPVPRIFQTLCAPDRFLQFLFPHLWAHLISVSHWWIISSLFCGFCVVT